MEGEALEKRRKTLNRKRKRYADMVAGLAMARQAMAMKPTMDDLKRRHDEIEPRQNWLKRKRGTDRCETRMEILRKESSPQDRGRRNWRETERTGAPQDPPAERRGPEGNRITSGQVLGPH
jgi:hypothetical protein